jgi:hypothetical protein
MGPKPLPTIWGTYMKLVTNYQISVINSCWEKCDEKCAYMFNVYKNQQSRQTGSRNLMCPKTLPMIWGTYIKLVTTYLISAINSCWEKCDEKCSYNPISWEAFLDPSDSYFLFADFVDFYAHWTYILYMPNLVAFFSATIDGRNLIFGHKLYIGIPYRGKHLFTRQIPTSCLPKNGGIISEH